MGTGVPLTPVLDNGGYKTVLFYPRSPERGYGIPAFPSTGVFLTPVLHHVGIKPFVLKIPPVTKYEGMLTSSPPEGEGKSGTAVAQGARIFYSGSAGGE